MKSRLPRFTKSEFFRNVFTLVSATGIAQAISLAAYFVLLRIYTPEEHGLFSLYLSIITITAIISTGKYELAIMIPKKERDGAGLTILSIALSLVFSMILLIFIVAFKGMIPGWLGNLHLAKWLLFIPLSTFLVAVFQTLSYWFNRKSDYKSIAGANLGQSIVNTAVKLSASKVMSNGGGLITGAIAGQAFGALVYLGRMFKEGFVAFQSFKLLALTKLAKEHSFFPRFSMLHKLINNFSSSLPIFVFSLYFSADIVGYFGTGFMLINRPMNLLSTAFSKVFSQRIIAAHNEGKFVFIDIRKFVFRMAAISIIPFTIVAAFGPWLVTTFFGDNWHEAGVYMQIFTPWLFVVFLSAPITFLSDMLSRQRKAMWIEVVKFGLRIAALAIGVYFNDVILALLLFSGSSMIVVGYSLFWYLKLAKRADSAKVTNDE
jgi:O-antigen/teichoic acid export membrane protein